MIYKATHYGHNDERTGGNTLHAEKLCFKKISVFQMYTYIVNQISNTIKINVIYSFDSVRII